MQKKNNNLDFLKVWMTFILEFLQHRKENPALFENMLTRVEKYYNQHNKKDMNLILTELHSILSTSSEEIQSALDNALNNKFNLIFKDIIPIAKKNQSLSKKQETEAVFIKDWCLTIIDFIHSKFKVEKNYIEMYKKTFAEEMKQHYLKKASSSIYVKSLRMAFNDINEMATGLPPIIQEELNKTLRKKFGNDLNYYSATLHRKIREIIKRGRIRNPDEFRLLKDRAEGILKEEELQTEVQEINRILLKYKEDTEPEI